MSTQEPDSSGVAGAAGHGPLPPPSPALLMALQGMQAVPTRVPGRSLAVIAAAAAVVPAIAFLRHGPRQDLGALPTVWVVAMALAWAAGLLVTLVPAVLPRKGEVLPDAARAARFALVTAGTLMLLALVATVDAPGHTQIPEAGAAAFGRRWWHCASMSLTIIAPVLVAGALVLRRLFPIGAPKVAAALGAAGGAIAGLTLHFICPIGGPLHVGLAHAGAIVVGALLGALFLSRILRA